MKKIAFISLFSLICMVSCNPKTEKMTETSTVEETKYQPTGNELRIVATMTVAPEYRTELMPIFDKMIKASRAEEGCIFYDLHEDINDSTKLIFLEEWKSQDAINIHNNSAHMKEYKEATAGKTVGTGVTLYKQILK
ncbi:MULTISPECIES: putative quinol monooxygenase [unclassified Dysgonomonas]|uniref:putative quinol monooxygenase n=1 Tax=unclassified Dysgonomonas TaxID=2630389 RepID=UPI00210427E0|nr:MULTISPECIES: putative quinol monooxygenase [unclassified Dysgonomonas]